MMTVTATFETNNCRTWITGETHTVSARLVEARESSPETFKLIRMDKGNAIEPKAKFSVGLY